MLNPPTVRVTREMKLISNFLANQIGEFIRRTSFPKGVSLVRGRGVTGVITAPPTGSSFISFLPDDH